MSTEASRANRRKSIDETRACLVERFPKAFMQKGAVKRPLKIGIHHDLFAGCSDLSHRRIREALRDYRLGITYLGQVVEGSGRVNLDGEIVDTVTASQAANAASELAKRNAARMRRRSPAPAELAPAA